MDPERETQIDNTNDDHTNPEPEWAILQNDNFHFEDILTRPLTMPPTPYISQRMSLKWEGEDSHELTDTLVLTSAYQRFVDIRILLPGTHTEPIFPIDTPEQNSSARIDWAFAGRSLSKPPKFADDGKMLTPRHTVWMHWVDNRSLTPLADEGDMYPTYGSDLTLEKGIMPHPITQINTAYEEVWKDVKIQKCGKETEYVSWVATLKDYIGNTRRGVLCRVGQYIQGVLRIGPGSDEVSVMRYKWEELENQQGVWKQELAIGRFPLDPLLLYPTEQVRINMEFEGDWGLKWRVVDVHYWPDGLTDEEKDILG